MQQAYFAGGCFWCITPVLRDADGVIDVISGYSGGTEANPTYNDVKHQRTGHRETVCVLYDSKKITYYSLLELFFSAIDPFDFGGQFIDRGHSYTTAIYYSSDDEKRAAQEKCDRLSLEACQPVAVCIEPFLSFYPAEDYHQNYDLTHPLEFEEELRLSGRGK